MPETDIANIATMAADDRRRALRRMKGGFAPFSYNPVRKQTLCIFNAQPPLLAVPETPWATIEQELKKACGANEAAVAANCEAGKLLFEFARDHGFAAEQVSIDGFPLTIGEKLTYWMNAVLIKDGQLIIAGTDFRRSGGYTAAGLKFVFSVMHEQIRALNPTDFGDARLGMFRLPQEPKQARTVDLKLWGEGDLYTYEEIIQMSLETYSTWREVLEEQGDDARKTGTGGGWWG